jgi:alpha-N-arabinofuranosidase
VVTKDSRTGRIYVAVVNPGGSAQPVTVDLAGAGTVADTGSQTVLSSAHPTDTNTISDPAHVVPVTSPVHGLGTTFTRTFAAYSLTILTVN